MKSRCGSFPLLSAPHSPFSIWTNLKRSEKIPGAPARRWGEWIWLTGPSGLHRNSPQGLNISSIGVFEQIRDPEIPITLRSHMFIVKFIIIVYLIDTQTYSFLFALLISRPNWKKKSQLIIRSRFQLRKIWSHYAIRAQVSKLRTVAIYINKNVNVRLYVAGNLRKFFTERFEILTQHSIRIRECYYIPII